LIAVADVAPTDPTVTTEDFPAVQIGRKLDIACGQNKQEGWIGIDICKTDQADIVHDLRVTPWPIESESIDEARASHFFEHLDGQERIRFMNELYRVLKPGRGCIFVTPYGYDRQVQDPTHKWPPVVDATYLYFDKQWLHANGLSHYIEMLGIECDFQVQPLSASVAPEFGGRSDQFKMMAVKQYRNGGYDLVVQVVKR